MNVIRETVKLVPGVIGAVKTMRLLQSKRKWLRIHKRTIQRLGRVGLVDAKQIKKAVCMISPFFPGKDGRIIRKIEEQRYRLLCDTSSLALNRLGPQGLYDEGVTIEDACLVSKSPVDALVMYGLVRRFSPLSVVEIGTNVGISSAYIAAALRINNKGGRVVTLDASGYRQEVASEVHRNLNLCNIEYVNGLFDEVLPTTLDRIGKVDFAFIDGNHQYKPTLDYFNMLLSKANDGAVFVLDDINWSSGMSRAWQDICSDSRLSLALGLGPFGIAIKSKSSLTHCIIND